MQIVTLARQVYFATCFSMENIEEVKILRHPLFLMSYLIVSNYIKSHIVQNGINQMKVGTTFLYYTPFNIFYMKY